LNALQRDVQIDRTLLDYFLDMAEKVAKRDLTRLAACGM